VVSDNLERRRQEENAAWASALATLREMFAGVTVGGDGVGSAGGMTPPKSADECRPKGTPRSQPLRDGA
jgi:hypothetical protein